MLLFKYLSPEGAFKALKRKGNVSIRFGLPKTYNDPYELFLQTDRPLESEEERAFYSFFLGEVLQAPVTCFSKRPDSVVMWAHYGHEATGACVVFDEDALADQFDLAYVEDVVYSAKPAQIDASMIERAFATGKRRHTLWALESAHRAAYFVKRTDWQYEAERRLVVLPEAVHKLGDILIARVSSVAVTQIILGARAEPRLRHLCKLRAAQFGVPLLEMKIGRKSYVPAFIGPRRRILRWSAGRFEEHAGGCGKCYADLLEDGRCQWCSISATSRRLAPLRSLLTASLHYGIDQGIPLTFEGLRPKGRSVKRTPIQE